MDEIAVDCGRAGGEAAETFPEVEAFDVRVGTRPALPDLPTPRHGLGVIAIGSTLYTIAGGPKPWPARGEHFGSDQSDFALLMKVAVT